MKKPSPAQDLSPLEARAEHERLADEISAHDLAYHQNDAPQISDAAYDALRRRLDDIEAAFPDLAKTAKSLSQKVGAAPSEKFGKVRHVVPMLSLSNIFDAADAGEFVERVRRFLGLGADKPLAFTAEPKIDGLSCSIRYVDGVLVQAATRGSPQSCDKTQQAPAHRHTHTFRD